MRRNILASAVLAAASFAVFGSPAMAADSNSFTVAALGGVGGSDDGQLDGFGETGFQLNLAFASQHRTLVVGRVGVLGLKAIEGATFSDPELTYLTISGEYRFLESYYDSGLFLGLGGYQLEANQDGQKVDETAIGLTFGVTGDFPMTPDWSIVIELSSHWVDFEDANFFATGQIGVAFSF